MQTGPQNNARIVSLLANPSFYLWRFEQGRALFIEMDRAAFHRSIFLDGRISPARQKVVPLDIGPLLEAHNRLATTPPEICYIFHVAHCGSTLLSRALDFKQETLVYREPQALRQLGAMAAGAGFSERPPEGWLQQLKLTTSLLGRSFNSGPVIVKANVPVNFIIPHVMDASPNTRGVILYATLGNYLLSILKSKHHREWVTQILDQLGPSMDVVVNMNATERRTLTLAQAAACLWLVQMTLFVKALAQFEDLRTLDSEVFFDQAAETLAGTSKFFGHELDPDALGGVMESRLFKTYSKNPTRMYDNNKRVSERDHFKTELGGELSEAREWIDKRLTTCPLPDRLGKPLIGQSPLLL